MQYGLSFEDTQRAIPEYKAIQSIEDAEERLKARNAIDEKYSIQEDFNRYYMAGRFIIDPMLIQRDDAILSFVNKAARVAPVMKLKPKGVR
jgi:hypothetical protein